MKPGLCVLTNIREGKFEGDKNQAFAIAVAIALQEDIPTTAVSVFDVNDKQALKTKLEESDSPNIVIGIGTHGIEALASIPKTSNTILLWAGHDNFPGLTKIANKVDLIALPSHLVDDVTWQGTAKLLPTNGVANLVTEQKLSEILQANEREKPEYGISVFLGGDAKDRLEPGKYSFFSENEAKALAQYIVEHYNKAVQDYSADAVKLFVTNSPRTGKYDPETHNERLFAHRSPVLDPVTCAFLNVLKQHDIPYEFANFQKGVPSKFEEYLALATCAYVTADSTSMLTEVLPHVEKMFVVKVGSMEECQHKHTQKLLGDSKVALISLEDDKYTCIATGQSKDNTPLLRAEKVIAQAVSVLLATQDKGVTYLSNADLARKSEQQEAPKSIAPVI